MAKACEECTQNCLMMHKERRNPASLVTTFCKVMMGDNYSKTMLLPPNFACRVKKLVGKTIHLEDLNGEKWDVKFSKIDDRLAFEDGWDTFALEHGLQKGDVLFFHCIMKSHFVVLMYGSTGLPETRHFGSLNHPTKETKKSSNKLTAKGQRSSKVNAICNNVSHESSSKAELPVHGVNSVKTVNKKGQEAMMSPNENNTDTQHLVASSSPVDKETGQRSEPLINHIVPDYMFPKSPVKPLADNTNGNEEDECRRNSLQPVAVAVESDGGQKNNVAASGGGSDEAEINRIQKSVESGNGQKNNVAVGGGGGSDESEINRIQKSVESDGGQKNNVVASGCGASETEVNRIEKSVESGGGRKNNVAASGGGADETEISRTRKWLEKQIVIADKKRKESTAVQSEVAHSNSMHKRLRPDNVPITPAQTVKTEPVTLVSRLHNSSYHFTSTGISPKPMAKRIEPVKKEPATNHGLGGLKKKEPAMNHGDSGVIKMEPKLELVDYDEAPLLGSSNTSFSAVMSSYQYLELPGWVKLKSKVILLRNGVDLWPVLYQTKYKLKVLTQNWSIFAKEKGIKPGDKCDFVLESEPTSRYACNVLDVHVTRQ